MRFLQEFKLLVHYSTYVTYWFRHWKTFSLVLNSFIFFFCLFNKKFFRYTSKNFIAFGQRIIKSMTNLKKFSIDLEEYIYFFWKTFFSYYCSCEFLNNDTYEKLTRRILFCLRNLIEVEFVAQRYIFFNSIHFNTHRNFQRNGVYIESLFENINNFSHKLRKLSIDFEM